MSGRAGAPGEGVRTGAGRGGRRRSGPKVTAPATPEGLLRSDLGSSGLPGASVLRRAGPRLGVRTVRDLLFHLPRRYDDLRELHRLGDLGAVPEGTVVSARVRVADIRVEQTWRKRVQRTSATFDDGTGTIEATWFGRRFIERRLKPGDEIVVSGRLRRRGWVQALDNPDFAPLDGSAVLHAGRIVPVYRLTAGLTATRLRAAMRAALDRAGASYPEYLPPTILASEGLGPIGPAIEQAHFPTDFPDRDAALRRLAFDELLALQLGMVVRRRQRGRSPGRVIAVDDATNARIRGGLAEALSRRLARRVALTLDQDAAIAAIREDLAEPSPMLRLIQGDVGSGKTAVAAYALAAVAMTGRQAAILAPTDLLARQHAETLADLLGDVGLPVTLLTGSLSADGRRTASQAIADGRASVVVGTHALIQESVRFADLALAVVDEQHRFGVEQRGMLEAKADGIPPHVLLMTATPIPRTLGQVIYADLDVSDLRASPEGRVPIRTAVRGWASLERLWSFVMEETGRGRRAFVVVPLIEESGDVEADPLATGAAAAEAEATRLRKRLAPRRVGLVHGRMRAADRDAEMARFRDGDLDVIVGTTVVEVGVDVPEATIMVVEDADRFGLAQLHQLRGRVGRGTLESYCVLVSDAEPGTTGWARLQAVERLRDGFDLAEEDFALRGEGDVLGLSQSGLPQLRVASLQLAEHREIAVAARRHAEALVAEDGSVAAGLPSLLRELREGWLTRVFTGDPASGA